jgi:lysozyme
VTLREQIQRDEGGYQRFAYQDTKTYWTIGFGRCIDRRKGKGISLGEAEFMLDNDIRDFTAEVLAALPWATTLDEPRRAVLVNMALNMGTAGLLGFPRMLAAMGIGDWYTAAAHLMDSDAARDAALRYERLAEQLRSGEWQ